MGYFAGKKGLILGVANDRSIAWAIAKEIMEQGGQCGFSHLPDRPDDEKRKNRRRVSQLTDQYPTQASFLEPLDVNQDDQIAAIMERARGQFGQIDFLLHSLAYATLDDLRRDTIDTSRDGFKLAMEISAYSLIAVSRAARPILAPGASILTMTYFGGERCVPGYNVMGICKAALEASMRYLAYDLGPSGVRVNALSAGPLKTLAGQVAGVGEMQALYQQMAPLQRNITHDEVGRTGAWLLSPLSDGMTSEIVHLDGGYNSMGSPGRMLDRLKTGAT